MRDGWPVRAWLPAALLCLLGCRDAPISEQAPTGDPPADVLAPSETGTQASQRLEGDPFAGIEALRPEPWTGWPLENVDIESETGWRIDPVSGEFVLERDLTFAADDDAFVLAIAPGKVIDLHRLESEDGALELVIDHGQGIESHYAPLGDALVHVGLPVTRGAAIGLAHGTTLRLRVTVDGVAIDPLLVLRQPLHRWPALLREPPTPPPPAASP
jgi:murein DD-endopeptidase MepM/ murein hydrolase activator NlpD